MKVEEEVGWGAAEDPEALELTLLHPLCYGLKKSSRYNRLEARRGAVRTTRCSTCGHFTSSTYHLLSSVYGERGFKPVRMDENPQHYH